MKRLHLRLPAREDWGRYVDASVSDGGVFCPTTDPPEVGSDVRLEITFVGGPRFLVHGTVMWRRPQLNDPRARAGAGIKVHAADRPKLGYLTAWARGGVLDKREVRRLPVRLRVTYSSRSGRRINFTRDLSEEGIFVRSHELLDLHTPIKLLVSPPGVNYKPLALNGVVARLVDSEEERGMGIQLVFNRQRDREHYIGFVRVLEQQYLTGALPDDVLS